MMKGEEFFGEVEERLIDRDLSWFLFFCVVFGLCFAVFVHLNETISIESYWTWSYWLEVMGFVLIVGDLFYREQTERFISLGTYFTPGDANWIGWWKFAAYNLIIVSLLTIAMLNLPPLGLVGLQRFLELPVFIGLGYSIGYGPYFYILGKTNDRVLGTGVGLALVGLTFATSAQITTTFF